MTVGKVILVTLTLIAIGLLIMFMVVVWKVNNEDDFPQFDDSIVTAKFEDDAWDLTCFPTVKLTDRKTYTKTKPGGWGK